MTREIQLRSGCNAVDASLFRSMSQSWRIHRHYPMFSSKWIRDLLVFPPSRCYECNSISPFELLQWKCDMQVKWKQLVGNLIKSIQFQMFSVETCCALCHQFNKHKSKYCSQDSDTRRCWISRIGLTHFENSAHILHNIYNQ